MSFDEHTTQAMKDRRRTATVIGLRKASTGELFPLDPQKQRWLLGSDSSCELRMHNDPFVSGVHCVIERSEDGVLFVRDRHSRNGTFVDGNHIEGAKLSVGSYLTVGRTTLVAVSKERGGGGEPRRALEILRGHSPVMCLAIENGIRAAHTECSVLIAGETGTGKDVMARLVHENSRRADGPFIAVNCGAIARDLIASELFGHERGAFTGASEGRDGYFVQADGGTLFLDEIGELPIELQPTLLRVLESRKVRRVGGQSEREVNVRIVAATNRIRNLGSPEMTHLRLDLYHRIATMVLMMPPLRDHMGDLPELVEAELESLAADYGQKTISEDGWEALVSYAWPGNVRELRHAIARAVALGDDVLGPLDFFPDLSMGNGLAFGAYPPLPSADGALVPYEAMLKSAMKQALQQHGTIRAAAQSLGMPKSTFADRAKEWGLVTTRRPRLPPVLRRK
jgi:transcriptional regulator with PAS, ATPase and Fis domain